MRYQRSRTPEEPAGRAGARLLLVLKQLRAGRPVRIRAWGASMEPAIGAGAELTIEPLSAAPRPGAIVALCRDDRFWVHRVVALERDGSCLVQGDNQASSDGWQEKNAIVGRVLGRDREGPLPSWGLKFFMHPAAAGQACAAEVDAFAALALTHGMAPWVGAQIQRGILAASWLPGDCARRAVKAYRACALMAERIASRQRALLAAYADAEIPAVALKGLALGKHLYGDVAARNQHDIDLLIGRADIFKAGRILEAQGFAPLTPRRLGRRHLGWHYDQSWLNAAGEKVELHWDLTQPGTQRVDLAGLFARAIRCPDLPDLGLVLALEDQVCYLALHAALDDRCLDLRGLFELALLVASDPVDWAQVCQRARRWGVARACWVALDAAARAFEAPVPSHVLAALAPSARAVRAWRSRLPLDVLVSRPPLNDPRWQALAWPSVSLPDRPAARLRRIAVQGLKSILRRAPKKPEV